MLERSVANESERCMLTNLEFERPALWREACHLYSVIPVHYSLHNKLQMDLNPRSTQLHTSKMTLTIC